MFVAMPYAVLFRTAYAAIEQACRARLPFDWRHMPIVRHAAGAR